MKIKTIFKPHEDLYELFTREERNRWAKNLRETYLKQCNGNMSKGEGTACCLHVWEVYEGNDSEWFEPFDMNDSAAGYPSTMEKNTRLESGCLPESVCIAYLEDGTVCYAAELNDDYGFTFGEIADMLEGQPVKKVM
ncbi:hypothetical protein N9043_00765 [bacterium]|nr:hypothetical protein [bacterium]